MILITGIKGFLASRLIEQMEEKRQIVGFGREQSITEHGIPIANSLEQIAREYRINTIYHLASFIPYGAYNQPDQRFISDNIELTIKLTRLFPEARIIYASSVSIYGSTASVPITVDTAIERPTLYGLSKLAGETVIRQHPSFGIVRFSSIIGKGMKINSFLPVIIKNAKQEQKITLLGNGARIQNYIDVRDAAALLLLLGASTENIITLGVAEKHYSNREIAEKVKEQINCEIIYKGHDNSENYVYEWPDSLEKIKFSPKYSIDDTIADIIYEI
jgi:UDP-glucose 4-epimerase